MYIEYKFKYIHRVKKTVLFMDNIIVTINISQVIPKLHKILLDLQKHEFRKSFKTS